MMFTVNQKNIMYALHLIHWIHIGNIWLLEELLWISQVICFYSVPDFLTSFPVALETLLSLMFEKIIWFKQRKLMASPLAFVLWHGPYISLYSNDTI